MRKIYEYILVVILAVILSIFIVKVTSGAEQFDNNSITLDVDGQSQNSATYTITVGIILDVEQFDIIFINESDHVIIAYLYQINHTMPNFGFPINRATGEIDPAESWTIQIEKGCEFFVVWRGPMSSMLQTKSTDVVVLSEDMVFRYQPIVVEGLDE